MRILVVSERLSRGMDDGIKNIALAFLRELRAQGHEVLGLSEWESLEKEGVEHFRSNRFYLSSSLARQVREFAPESIVYVPWTSATARGLFRLWMLKRYAAGATTCLVATQPLPLGFLGKRVAAALHPDLIFVQCPETRRVLESAGCDTAFLPSGYDPGRFRPGSAEDRPRLKKKFSLSPDAPLLTHVGHLKRERIDTALMRSLLTSVPGLQILLVGSPHTPQDETLARELDEMGVHLVRDYVEDIAEIYHASDVYLFPVTNRFACVGIPLSVIEAMACNIPVVSTSFGGLEDLFGGHPGVQFADGAEAIGAGVRKALTLEDPGNQSVVESLTWERIIADAMKVLGAGRERRLERARYVLSLLAQDATSTDVSCGMSPGEARKELKVNKIPMLALSADRCREASLSRYRDEAPPLLEHQRGEFHACRRALEAHGIRIAYTKSVGPLPYESDNMDILVRPEQIEEAIQVLGQELGYVKLEHYREDYKIMMKRFEGDRLQNWMHYHEEVSWGVEHFLDRNSMWERCRLSPDEPDVLILSREDAFLTVTAHAVFENDRIKLGDLWKVRHLLGEGDLDWDYCRGIARSLGWEIGYDLILFLFPACEDRLWGASKIPAARRQEAEARLERSWVGWRARQILRRPVRFPMPLSRLFTKALFYRKILTNPASSPGRKFRHLMGATRDNFEALLGVSHQRAFAVSFSGIDGSGKSTLIEAVTRSLDQLEVTWRVVWVRGGNTAPMRFANKWFRRLMGRRMQGVVSDGGRKAQREAVIQSRLWRILWPWIVSLELGLLLTLRARFAMWRGHVVLLDRSVHDTLLDLRIRCADPHVERRLPLRLLAKIAPRTGVSWYFKVDPAVAHQRKDEDYTLEMLTRRSQDYDDYATAAGMRVVRTDQELEAAVQEVVSTTLQAYFGSYP